MSGPSTAVLSPRLWQWFVFSLAAVCAGLIAWGARDASPS